MKKKVLFMVINMNIGGTEKALLNLLETLPKDQLDITILMLEHKGGFLDFIPKGVNVEVLDGYEKYKELIHQPPLLNIKNLLADRKLIQSFILLFAYILFRIGVNQVLYYKYLLRDLADYKNKYDIAIAYAGPMDFISYFVAHKIKAKKKVQWIHFDIERVGFHKKFAKKIYSGYNQVFVVSEEGKEKLVRMIPTISKNIDVFKNTISKSVVLQQSNEGLGFTDKFEGVKVLTVGRLSKEKGQDMIIPVLAKLKAQGINIRWYCVGEGAARREYELLAKEYGVEEMFILLGAKTNPYPYMKQCDIYVQPSRHEGYCITLAEALCFNKPIITTNFTGAKEQVVENETGIIIEPNKQQLYDAIIKLLTDNELKLYLEVNHKNSKENSKNISKKIFQLISG